MKKKKKEAPSSNSSSSTYMDRPLYCHGWFLACVGISLGTTLAIFLVAGVLTAQNSEPVTVLLLRNGAEWNPETLPSSSSFQSDGGDGRGCVRGETKNGFCRVSDISGLSSGVEDIAAGRVLVESTRGHLRKDLRLAAMRLNGHASKDETYQDVMTRRNGHLPRFDFYPAAAAAAAAETGRKIADLHSEVVTGQTLVAVKLGEEPLFRS